MGEFAELVKGNSVDVLSGMADAYKEMKEEALTKMKTAFQPAFAHFFEKFPQVTAIVWTQFTPYFNDGEPCEFGTNSKYFTTDENPDLETRYVEDSEGTWYGEYCTPAPLAECEDDILRHPNESYYLKKYDKAKAYWTPENAWVAEAQVELDKFSDIPDEVYQTLGEGKVVVTRKGIDVEEFDHD